MLPLFGEVGLWQSKWLIIATTEWEMFGETKKAYQFVQSRIRQDYDSFFLSFFLTCIDHFILDLNRWKDYYSYAMVPQSQNYANAKEVIKACLKKKKRFLSSSHCSCMIHISVFFAWNHLPPFCSQDFLTSLS